MARADTIGSNPFPFGALEDEEPNLATTRAGGQQRETADQDQPPDEHRPSRAQGRGPSTAAIGPREVVRPVRQSVLSRDEYRLSRESSVSAAVGARTPFVTMSRFSSRLP